MKPSFFGCISSKYISAILPLDLSVEIWLNMFALGDWLFRLSDMLTITVDSLALPGAGVSPPWDQW